jgi:hypothetical protein
MCSHVFEDEWFVASLVYFGVPLFCREVNPHLVVLETPKHVLVKTCDKTRSVKHACSKHPIRQASVDISIWLLITREEGSYLRTTLRVVLSLTTTTLLNFNYFLVLVLMFVSVILRRCQYLTLFGFRSCFLVHITNHSLLGSTNYFAIPLFKANFLLPNILLVFACLLAPSRQVLTMRLSPSTSLYVHRSVRM